MRYLPALAALPLLLSCADETLTGYGDGVYRLSEIDGAPFSARATLSLAEPGRISGETPCNSYTGALESPYPWFRPGPLAVTRRACADSGSEARFLDALGAMTLAETSGPVLLLTTDDGARSMTFHREE